MDNKIQVVNAPYVMNQVRYLKIFALINTEYVRDVYLISGKEFALYARNIFV